MGESNNALNAYMGRPDRIRSVLEYYIGEKLPEDWSIEKEDGFYTIRNSKGKLSFRQRDGIRRIRGKGWGFYLGEEETDMCKALKEIVKDAERQGMKQGVKQGENLLGTLIDRLLSDERTEDAKLAAVDATARNRLYRDYGILNS